MIINKIEVTNWMGHEKKALELKEGRNLILGRNAAGKSSLAKAIAFNLTGYLPKMVDPRRNASKASVVTLNITANDNKKYLVRRQVDDSKKGKVSLFIYEENNPSVAKYVSEDAEAFLREQSGLASDVFERVIYMKEEDVHDFLSKPASAVMREIDRLIGLEKAHQLSRDIDELKKEFDAVRKSTERNRKEIETAVKRDLGLSETKADIKKANERMEAIPIELTELLELQGHYQEQEELLSKINEIKKTIEVGNIKELEPKLINLQMSYEKTKKDLEKIISENKTHLEKMQLTQGTIQAKSDLKKRIVEDLEESEVTECPTCGREMDKKTIAEVIKKQKLELKTLASDLDTQIKKVDSLKKDNEKKQMEVTEQERKISLMKDLKEQATKILSSLNPTEEGIKQLEKKGYPKSVKEIEIKLSQLEEEEKSLRDILSRAKGAEEVTQKMVEKEIKKEEELKHKLKILEIIEKAIEETANNQRQSYSAEVKNHAEKIWSAYKKEKWQIEWDENFVPKAKPLNSQRELTAYEMSGSERFLILLAIRIAIQESMDQFNLLIIDEPCQHLDNVNGRAFRDILTDIAEEKIKQSIIFTYNEDFLEGNWSNIVKLT